MISKAVIFFGCLLILIGSSASASAALFAIASPVFSASVTDSWVPVDPAEGGAISRSRLKDGRLFFSFTVIGGRAAIDELQKYHTLKVKAAVWSFFRRLRDYSIGITEDNWERNGKALTEEFRQNGFFTWRTKLYTDQTKHSSIYVKIWDGNDDDAALIGDESAYLPKVRIEP